MTIKWRNLQIRILAYGGGFAVGRGIAIVNGIENNGPYWIAIGIIALIDTIFMLTAD